MRAAGEASKDMPFSKFGPWGETALTGFCLTHVNLDMASCWTRLSDAEKAVAAAELRLCAACI